MPLYNSLVYPEESLGEADALRWKRFKVCEHMHWDIYTYRKQPAWFINEIWIFMKTESSALQDKGQKNG